MTFRKRRILLIVIIILFSLVTPIIILFSEGYKFDFKNKRIVQTGGIYIKALPPSSEVSINHKSKGKTNFLTGALLITNLIPNIYKVEIRRKGYFPWFKELKVEEKQVSQAQNVWLFPNNIKFHLLEPKSGSTSTSTSIQKFIISPDQSKIVLFKVDGSHQKLELIDLNKNRSKNIWNNIGQDKQNLINFYWSPDNQNIFLETENRKKIKRYSLINLSKLDNIYSTSSNKKIFSWSSQENELIRDIIKKSVSYKIFPNSIVWLSPNGFLIKSNLKGKIIKIYNLSPFPLEKDISYQIIGKENKIIFVKEKTNLYFLSPQKHTFIKISSGANYTSLSPDAKKIAISDGYGIWIFHPQSSSKLSPVFLTRFSQKINNLNWVNNYYLIFSLGDEIKVSEIDEKNRLNINSIANFPHPIFDFDRTNKEIYLQSQGKLYTSSPLL